MQKKRIDDQSQPAPDEQKPVGEQVSESAQQAVTEAKQEVAEARRPWYRTIYWGRVLIMVYVIWMALFALLAWWVYYHPVLGIDVAITREFQENQTPLVKDTMIAVSYPGNAAWLSTGFIIVAAIIFWVLDLRLEALIIPIHSIVSALINVGIKLLISRPRPSASLVEVFQVASGKSFPSGHVMAYVAFWGLLFSFGLILFRGKYWWRIALLIISAIMVVLVGPSRIYLGDHWASDVLGAYIIGGVLLGITLSIYLKLKEKGVLAPRSTRWKYIRYAKKAA